MLLIAVLEVRRSRWGRGFGDGVALTGEAAALLGSLHLGSLNSVSSSSKWLEVVRLL